MKRFKVLAMDTSAANRIRSTGLDDRGGRVHRRIVDGPGFPCRHCLQLGRQGETMLLASWDLRRPIGPYWTPSPVFLHAGNCVRAEESDALPETVLRNSLVSLRHYDHDDLCLYDLGVVVPGDEADLALRARISDPRIAFVNIHTAKPGCWLASVEPIA